MQTNSSSISTTTDTLSIQFSRPRLKAGQIFSSPVSILYELEDGSRQVSLSSEAHQILPLLDGSRTIPDLLGHLQQTKGHISFKLFFATLQKLQTHGCLEGAEILATADAQAHVEMFERERLWLTRPILSWPLVQGKVLGEASALAFLLFSFGTLIVTLSFLFGAIALDFVRVPIAFLRIQESYIKGLIFFFLAASILITAKTLIKTILSLLLTGARSRLVLELGLYSFAVRSQDDKIYVAGGRLLGTLAFAAIASSYFFVFAVATAVAPHWSMLDDLFWVSVILALIDLNPFRRSDLSSFFNLVYNSQSRTELLPYLQNRGLLSLQKNESIADSAVYTAYSTLAILWTMVAYNVLLALITRNDTLLVSTLKNTFQSGNYAEFLAAVIIAMTLGLSITYLVVDLFKTLWQNLAYPLRARRLVAQSIKRTSIETLENVQVLAASLANVPLFLGMHQDAVMFLLSKGRPRKIAKGTHLVIQGTQSDELFILIEGEVAVRKNHPTGGVKFITTLKAPTVFGENTLLANRPRSADIIATTDTRVVAISRKTIDEFVHHPTLKTEADTLLDRLILGQYVASSELFRDAPSEVISLFFNAGEILNVASGRHVIEQGRTDKDFYLLLRGSVDVIRNGNSVAHLQQGDFFGEMALLLNTPRTATIMTREPCRFLKLSTSQFWQVLSHHASIALYLETISDQRFGEISQ